MRLRERVKVRRVVRVTETADVMDAFQSRIADGFLYGDFQFTIDAGAGDFLRRGVFSCYEPVRCDTPLTQDPICFSHDDWSRLIFYAHQDKRHAFDLYSARYLETSGQIYWADSQLAASYFDGYHDDLDRATGAGVKGSEMITELFVPRARLAAFMDDARRVLREHRANVIYGTVRLIDNDDETMLTWAREPWACIVFNLHVDHTATAVEAAADAFRVAHRSGDRARRQLLPHLPSLGETRSSGALLPAVPRVPGRQAPARSGGTLPERLVPALLPVIRRLNLLDDARRGPPGLDRDPDDPPAARFDRVAADDGVGGPVGAFDEHVRLNLADDLGGRFLVEDHRRIDARERGHNLRPLALRRDRPFGSLVRPDGSIGIDRDDQQIARAPRGLQVPHVTRVQQVEDAVGENDLAARTALAVCKIHHFGLGKKTHSQLTPDS